MAKTKALDKGKTLTAAHEDYIKAIYLLRSQDEEVTNSALANHLNVSPASATNMVKKLADLNLVEYEPYQSISLTVSGERALEVLRHHRLLELYLHQELLLRGPGTRRGGTAGACDQRSPGGRHLARPGQSLVDPHGDPIPTKKGMVESVGDSPERGACIANTGSCASSCKTRNAALSRRWASTQRRHLAARAGAFDGSLLVDIDGEHHALAYDMAASLLVVAWDETVEE